jgi:hypothetical protein
MKVKRNVVDYVEGSIEGLRSQLNKKIEQVSGKVKETLNNGAEAATSKIRNHG